MKKKWIAAILSAVMVSSLLCMAAQASIPEIIIDGAVVQSRSEDSDILCLDTRGRDRHYDILMVGNSKTKSGSYDIPKMFGEMCTAAGWDVDVTCLNTNICEVDNSPANIALAQSKVFDIVVLQEQSWYVVEGKLDNYLNSVKQALNIIRAKSPNAEIYLRETWPRADAVKANPNQREITKSYSEQVAAAYGLHVVYDGQAAYKCEELYPNIKIWRDGTHLNADNGAYLLCCTLYIYIMGESPVGIGYQNPLSGELAGKLQNVSVEAYIEPPLVITADDSAEPDIVVRDIEP